MMLQMKFDYNQPAGLKDIHIEACIGGYPISHIPGSKRGSIPYKLVNIPIIKFPKYSISLKVTKILNTVSNIPGSEMDSILYPWK